MTVLSAPSTDKVSLARPYLGIIALVVAIVVAAAVGFRPTYFGLPQFTSTGWQVHFHVATVVLWLAMLVAQGWLASTGRIDGHRRIGRVSYVLVPVIVLGFVLVMDFGQRRHADPQLLGLVVFDGGFFLFLYAMAIVRRRKTAQHARYMMLTPVAFMNPTLGRAITPAVSVPLQLVLLLGLLIVAKARKKPWQPYAVALVGWVLLTVLLGLIGALHIDQWVWEKVWG